MGGHSDFERHAAFLQTVGDQHRDFVEKVVERDFGIVQPHDAGIDSRKIEDVVDQCQQHRGRGGDMIDIFRLPVVQRSDARRSSGDR